MSTVRAGLYMVIALATLHPASAASKAPAAEAAVMAEKFLEAMGGRKAWAKATYVHSWAVNHHPQARLPYTQEYWTDFRQPRTLNRLKNFDMNRLRGFNIDNGWGVSEGKVYKFEPERIANELKSWRQSIYGKLMAIARRDKNVQYEWSNGRLNFRKAGVEFGWIELDANGAPKRYSGTAQGSPVTFGPLVSFGNINWPKHGTEDGGWRFEMLAIELGYGPLPVSFELPGDLDNLDP